MNSILRIQLRVTNLTDLLAEIEHSLKQDNAEFYEAKTLRYDHELVEYLDKIISERLARWREVKAQLTEANIEMAATKCVASRKAKNSSNFKGQAIRH